MKRATIVSGATVFIGLSLFSNPSKSMATTSPASVCSLSIASSLLLATETIELKKAYEKGVVKLTFTARDEGKAVDLTVKNISLAPVAIFVQEGKTAFETFDRKIFLISDERKEIAIAADAEKTLTFPIEQEGVGRWTSGSITLQLLPTGRGTKPEFETTGDKILGDTNFFSEEYANRIRLLMKVSQKFALRVPSEKQPAIDEIKKKYGKPDKTVEDRLENLFPGPHGYRETLDKVLVYHYGRFGFVVPKDQPEGKVVFVIGEGGKT